MNERRLFLVHILYFSIIIWYYLFAMRIYSFVTYVKINKPKMYDDTKSKKWTNLVRSLLFVVF